MIEIKLPKIDDDHDESSIIFWHKQEGNRVKKDDILVEVQTEKAVTEIEAEHDGVINEIVVKRGEVASVDDVLCTIKPEGNDNESKETHTQGKEEVAEAQEKLEKASFIRVPPRLRKLAKDLKVELTNVTGTGNGGKITEQDIRQASGEGNNASEDHAGEKLTGIRRTIATRMKESMQNSAQLTVTAYADVTELANIRQNKREKVSWNTWFMYAAIKALKKHPSLNAIYKDDLYMQFDEVHLGFATDTEEGLIVPVVRDAHLLSLVELNTNIDQLATLVRDKKTNSKDLTGSTFTVTNLGSFGVHFFTPIINPPEVAILGIGKIETYLVLEDGIPIEKKRLPISLTFDHQVIDGAPAGRFMMSFVAFLENPGMLNE